MAAAVVEALAREGVTRGSLVALAIAPSGAALATTRSVHSGLEPAADVVREVDAELRPRWVVWSGDTPAMLVADGVRISTSWDLAAVHRLLFGGWRADPARIWARLHDLSVETLPA